MSDDLFPWEEPEADPEFDDWQDYRIQAIYDHIVDELLNGAVATNTDVDDYQCPHRWREIVIAGQDCSECEVCHAIGC